MAGLFNKNKDKVINKVVELSAEKIVPNPYQPRQEFGEKELCALTESIKQNGILQPLTVRKIGDESYELVAGERRLRAAKRAELKVVPCIIVDITQRNSAVLALVENIQRQDLSYFDEAFAIEKLIDFYGMTQEDAAVKLGKAQSTIANKLRLLKFSDDERAKISEAGLTERHARALLKLPDSEMRFEAIERISKFNLNVERSELMIERMIYEHKEIESIRKRAVVFKDVRLFVNTINKAVETMQAAGIEADSQKIKHDDYIEYVVRIPVNSPKTATT